MDIHQQLHKIHAQGNDFIIIPEKFHSHFTQKKHKQLLAHRHIGVGADQLLFVHIDTSRHAWSCTIANQDGTEASICLNGIYACACLIHQHFPKVTKWDIQINQMTLRSTLYNNKPSIIIPQNFSTHIQPLTLSHITIKEPAYYIHTANEHILLNTDNTSTYPLVNKAREITKLYPQGINVSCFNAEENTIIIRTFERGCGLTYSCGSAGLAACLLHWQKHPSTQMITVRHPGGDNTYTKTQENTIRIQGSYGHIASFNYSTHLHQGTPLAQLVDQYQIDTVQSTEAFS